MGKLKKVREAIKNYKKEKGYEHERIILSKKFYNQLTKEIAESNFKAPVKKINNTVFHEEGMEIKEGVNFDFKLLP